jgi:polysaccharide chain length determinant protein (PEP-CTERM system associated)
MEQLQIIEGRLLTRDNLLTIANTMEVVRDQDELSPDEIVAAMRAQTTVRRRSGRNEATVMSISYMAPTPEAAAAVVNAYLTQILESDLEYRTGRAENTQQFFEQQVQQLSQNLANASERILVFKNENADALPETLDFRLSERSRILDNLAAIDTDIASLIRQRDQLITLAKMATPSNVGAQNQAQLSPRQQRLVALENELDRALSIYSEQSPRIRIMRAEIARLEASVTADQNAAVASASNEEEATIAEASGNNPLLGAQLSEIDSRVESQRARRVALQQRLEALSETIARTPANSITLGGLERDFSNIQNEYNTAVNRLGQASTGERIELLSRGQRITVIEPPVVPTEPSKPNRVRLAGAGSVLGILAGLALVVLIEMLQRSPRRAEDIVARFDVMPIATIPYIRSRRQLVVDRSIKILITLAILVGIPAAIYAVHQYYMPLDLVADKVMNRLGVRW